MPSERRVSDADAERLLYDLIAVPSLSGQEHAAVRALVRWMQVRGFDRAYVDEAGSAVGIVGNGAYDVVLLGHIDTFPGALPVYRDGRRLYGRGAVDAKGPLCAFVVAALRAAVRADMRLIVIGAVEEESATSRGARHAARCFRPAACVIGEPSRWDRITLGYKGRLLADWQWRGPLAHSAAAVASPAERAVAYWERVRACAAAVNSSRDSTFERLDVTLRAVNTHDDGAHGEAHLTLGFRLPLGTPPESVVAALSDGEGSVVRVYGAEPAFTAERDTALSRALRSAIRAHGGQPRFVHKTGTSDMNVVGPLWNCPIAAYGPGDSALDHTPDEHIDLDEYLLSISVLSTALEHLRLEA